MPCYGGQLGIYPILIDLCCIFGLCIVQVKSSDILGCGGYVKSDVDMNYAKVKIKLLTQHGNLKYETECAPNNGYYFIPLYDKGEYILKVSPPSGWSFDPEEIALRVDGETDPCSLNQDINFSFKGFAILGRVVSIGSSSGPAGLIVLLMQGKNEVMRTVTSDGGNYIFTPLASGIYEVIPSHPTWNIVKDKVKVVVTDENGDAGSSLVIGGYTLSGSVVTSSTVTENMRIVLHSPSKFSHKLGCTPGAPNRYQSPVKEPVLCHTSLNQEGDFQFSSITTGKYIIVPFLPVTDIKYEITPSKILIDVAHQDRQIGEKFQIEGCTLMGKVVHDKDSGPISGARVELDGELRTITNKDGKFVFESVVFGQHTVRVSADGLEFQPFSVTMNLENHAALLITPFKYKTCFTVNLDAASEANVPWTISIEGSESKHQIETDSSGVGCLFLTPGAYSASVVLTPQDEEAGIRFGPEMRSFEVTSQPVSLSFSQFVAEIQGTLDCLESCRLLAVTLRPSRGSSLPPRITTSSQGKFTFKEVVPGEYLLSIDKEEWCWKEPTQTISVNSKLVIAKFEQTGYRLTLNASHRTTLHYMTKAGQTGTLEVVEGTSRECVSSSGKYTFNTSGCHKFGNAPLIWDTSSPQLLSLLATHHQVTGTLTSIETGPFIITVKKESGTEEVIGPLVASPESSNVYIFEYFLPEGETALFTPSSSTNLFQFFPPSHSLKMENDCLFSAMTFEAERASFLKGLVKPPLKGATITVKGSAVGLEEPQTYTTNADGVFIIGPLDKTEVYTVEAGKLGYTISPDSVTVDMNSQKSEIIKVSFEAYKLAEIIVKIVDDDGNPLPGVLVSTSGGKNYRKNSLTEADGTIAFVSLMPNDYFLRPMMKEHTFEPSSKMATVQSGATVNVSIRAFRVAYSIFGECLSLNGDPEADVVVEVIGVAPVCQDLQEEAVSDTQGNFRIRGLIPKCDYMVRLKKGEDVNAHIDRALPSEQLVIMEAADYLNMKVVVIRPFRQMDVSIYVMTNNFYLPSLSAKLFRDDQPDSPVHSLAVGQHPFFMLPPMIADNLSYTLQLVSSLPRSQYSFQIPLVGFTANSSFIHLEMSFNPKLKSVEAEISRGTVFAFLVFIFLFAVSLNYNSIQPYVLKWIDSYMYKQKASNNTQSSSSTFFDNTSSYIEPVSNVKKRVKLRKI